MKKLKTKKRVQSTIDKHQCQFEYNNILSSPDKTVFSCTRLNCGNVIVENEDSGSAGC